MTPELTFFLGLVGLGLFGWYFIESDPFRKKVSALVLTLFVAGMALFWAYPPLDQYDATGKRIPGTPAGKLKLGLDLKGGTAFQIRLVRESKESEITKDMQEQAVEVIRGRVDKFGVGEPIISPVGSDQLLVQIPGLETSDIANVRTQLQRVAKLEFKLVHPQSESLLAQIEAGQGIVPPGYEALEYKDEDEDEAKAPAAKASEVKKARKSGLRMIVKKRADMTGERVTQAFPFFDMQGWGVTLKFDGTGTKQFGDLTAANVGQRLAIVLDRQVTSAPVLRDAIYGGSAQITGRFKEKQARDLASVLENPLQTPVKIEEERSVSASLGKDSIRSGVIAGVVGILATFAAALLYYRFAGIVATVALLVNLILLIGVMCQFGFVLTLPGIAGIVLTIGMAVDANVLIYERLREEQAAGKSTRAALEGAYDKAFSSIFDANVTTLITSVILFVLATGPVKGFAISLTVGIVCSLFSALLVTRMMFSWGLDNFGLKKLSMAQFIKPGTTYDFMGKAKMWGGISLAVIVISMAVFAFRGKHNFGIDFRGGDLLILSSAKPVKTDEVRDALGKIGLGESTVQIETQPDGKEFLNVRSDFDSSARIFKSLTEQLPDRGLAIVQQEKVGALVGAELAKKSGLALLLGMLGIFIYVAARFEMSFAIGAIVALLHDVIITVGAFALLGKEMSLIMVGAVLTIAGYSINDTIVVFDRIRTGVKEGRRGNIMELMNACINETLSRTLLTSGLTMLTVLALLFLGGPVLHVFGLAMTVGLIAGTYSSVFIAAPIVMWWANTHSGGLREEMERAQFANPGSSQVKVQVQA